MQRCCTRFGGKRKTPYVVLANEPGHLFCLRDVVQLYLHLFHSLPPGNTTSICIGMVLKEIGCEGLDGIELA